jgi:hypothetical protein
MGIAEAADRLPALVLEAIRAISSSGPVTYCGGVSLGKRSSVFILIHQLDSTMPPTPPTPTTEPCSGISDRTEFIGFLGRPLIYIYF